MQKIAQKLSKAIFNNEVQLVEQLLEEYGDRLQHNKANKQGDSYLTLAIARCSAKVVELLLKKGTDPNFTWENDRLINPLEITVGESFMEDRLQKIKLLLNYADDLKLPNYALHHAVANYNCADVVKLLIELSLDINLQNNHGDTPLIIASLNPYGETYVVELIKAGAKLDIANKLGINFSLGVIAYKKQQVIRLLKRKQYRCNLDKFINQSLNFNEQAPQKISSKALEYTYYPHYLAEIITFFSLSASEQIKTLPVLDREYKFDCSGDIVTNWALLVLASEYESQINKCLLRMMDYPDSEYLLLDDALQIIYAWIGNEARDFDKLWAGEYLFEPEWILVRKLSQYLKQYLAISVEIDKDCLTKIIFSCLHA